MSEGDVSTTTSTSTASRWRIFSVTFRDVLRLIPLLVYFDDVACVVWICRRQFWRFGGTEKRSTIETSKLDKFQVRLKRLQDWRTFMKIWNLKGFLVSFSLFSSFQHNWQWTTRSFIVLILYVPQKEWKDEKTK